MALAEGRSVAGSYVSEPSAAAAHFSLALSLSVLAILLLCRLLLAANADLAEDEAYYWLWSTGLASGYYDHPPMIAYWIKAGTIIFGKTAFGVRFIGLLSSLAGSYLLYLTCLSLFRDRSAALLAVIWLNATLLLNAAAIVATPDTPLALFATLTLFALAKLIGTGRGAWWYAAGAALGLAFMSKYTAVLLLPGVFLWTIASAEGRRWLLRPEPYLGALLAAAVVSPVFYWNYAHDWVSFAKQAHHSVKDKPANALMSMMEFLGGQAGLATPIIFAFCVWGSFFAFLRGWKRQDSRWFLLGALTVPVLLFFLVHSASQKIQPNWPGFIYPAAILAGVQGYVSLSKEREQRGWVKASFKLAPWVGLAFTLAAFLQLGFGVLPIEAKKDPTSRLKGWEKLGAEVAEMARARGAVSILTANYAATGELSFYGAPEVGVLQWNERIRYVNLPPPDEDRLKNGPCLLVVRQNSDVSKATAFFANSRFVATVKREGGLRSRDAYDVYLLSSYRGGLSGEGAGNF
jgi:4-amino-4-deoxy-L-arabinose transferase-like glycosyltransferase